MKKLLLLCAVLAMMLVAVAPALAQVGAESGLEEVESGDAEGSAEVANKGDLSNQCAPILNVLNSGSPVSTAALSQYITETDDIEIEGSTIEISPELAAECNQSIAVNKGEVKAGEAKVEVKAGEAPKVEVKAGEAPGVAVAPGGAVVAAPGGAAEVKQLPKTGGEASLLALGAGALLVAGGLLVRRIIR